MEIKVVHMKWNCSNIILGISSTHFFGLILKKNRGKVHVESYVFIVLNFNTHFLATQYYQIFIHSMLLH